MCHASGWRRPESQIRRAGRGCIRKKAEQVSSPRPVSRIVAILLLIAGFAIALLAAFADTAGYGTGRGFGYYQMIILIGGIVTALLGVALLIHGRSGRDDSGDFEPEP